MAVHASLSFPTSGGAAATATEQATKHGAHSSATARCRPHACLSLSLLGASSTWVMSGRAALDHVLSRRPSLTPRHSEQKAAGARPALPTVWRGVGKGRRESTRTACECVFANGLVERVARE